MSIKIFKRNVVSWAKGIGRKEAVKRLVCLGVSPRMAEGLVKGTYMSTPHDETVDLIQREITKGIVTIKTG